ncbi:ABC transporter [Trypanosoma brucei equiperdum]|uniref:ABC transporter n=1 Tax=Trypanosoma brucei equiperdum TaxID=630700 RepID=A0A3L6L0Q9_9TRYP|nr:ABC transporter [Trypanosoma brucei equiperdum]
MRCFRKKVRDEEEFTLTSSVSEELQGDICNDGKPYGNADPQEQVPETGDITQFFGSFVQPNASMVGNSFCTTPFPVPVSWHNLTYSLQGRVILHNLTGTALPSRCLAIMGASGAGKSTFLHALSDHLATSKDRKLEGKIQLGDVEYRHQYRKVMGFVGQDDVLSNISTPKRSLRFSVRVRRNPDPETTKQQVSDVMDELGLQHCRDTTVGTPGLVAGLSGGERKRCSMGVDLICDPKILLLDEPTSGLDHVTSAKVVQLLNTIARKGRTVIYTIHQSSAGVLNHFDDLMLLVRGRCVYHGTMEDSVAYFESIGYVCPETYTPTDFYMTLMQDSVQAKVLIKQWKRHVKRKRTLHTRVVELNHQPWTSDTAKFLHGYIQRFKGSAVSQFSELVRRDFTELIRNRTFIITSLFQSLIFSLVAGLIFFGVSSDMTGIQDREGVLFMVVINRAMGQTYTMMHRFYDFKALYIREQQVGSYPPLLYLLSKTIVETPYRLLFCLVECAVVYWMVGLYASAGAFFTFYAAIALLSEVAASLGFLLSATCSTSVGATGFAPIVLLPLTLVGGLYATTDRMRPYWYFLEKLSFFRHAYILVLRNEMKHIDEIECDEKTNASGLCGYIPANGKEVLELNGLEDGQSENWIMWLCLVLFYVLLRTGILGALYKAARHKL